MASLALEAESAHRPQIADILKDHAHGLRLTSPQARAVRDIVACRTERLGGSIWRSARSAVSSAAPTTPAATGIVPSARS